MSSGLSARDLAFHRGKRRIIDSVSLDLEAGAFTSLIGANGSGKTTLLRLLLGLLPATEGRVMLDGTDLARWPRRRIASRIAYVPQSHVPAFPFTVAEIVGMGRAPVAGLGARLGRDDVRAVEAALDRVNMRAFADRNYADLSGGERQAVLIARALAQAATILLLDEPTASLDLGQQFRLMETISALTSDGLAVLASVHHPETALRWSHRAIVMRQGRIMTQGPTCEVLDETVLSEIYNLDVRIINVGNSNFVMI